MRLLCVLTSVADLQVDGEDGVGAGRVFVHQREAHCPVPPALLYDSLTLPHVVHGVHGKVPHIHPTLWVLFQLRAHENTQSLNLPSQSNTLSFSGSCNNSFYESP